MMNDLNFHRSAIEPVGIVAVVSMKATMYKKKAMMAPLFTRSPALKALPAQPPCQRNTQSPLPISELPAAWVKP